MDVFLENICSSTLCHLSSVFDRLLSGESACNATICHSFNKHRSKGWSTSGNICSSREESFLLKRETSSVFHYIKELFQLRFSYSIIWMIHNQSFA